MAYGLWGRLHPFRYDPIIFFNQQRAEINILQLDGERRAAVSLRPHPNRYEYIYNVADMRYEYICNDLYIYSDIYIY